MKLLKIILVLIYSIPVSAQFTPYKFFNFDILNYDAYFRHNIPGQSTQVINDFSYFTSQAPGGCWTFHTDLTNFPNKGTRPGLDISHGVPHFEQELSDGWCLYMEDNILNQLGHGVLIEAPFQANTEYIISFSLCCDDEQYPTGKTDLSHGILRFAIPDGKPFNRNFGHCGDQIPNNSLLAVQDFNAGSINPFYTQFQVTPSGNSDFLWVLPIQTTPHIGPDGNAILTSVRIRHVAIQQKCTSGPCLEIFGNFIPPKIYKHNDCIMAGSQLNNYSPMLAAIDPTQNTVFNATKVIEIKDNFLADPQSFGHYFLAEVKPGMCNMMNCNDAWNPPGIMTQFCEGDDWCAFRKTGGQGKPGKNITSDNINYYASYNPEYSPYKMSTSDDKKRTVADKASHDINIYPNPTTGAFNIEVPQVGNYTIRVMNMLGSTVYEGKMADEQKQSIQLDNNLPPGNYTLHISGDGLRHVKRITLTK